MILVLFYRFCFLYQKHDDNNDDNVNEDDGDDDNETRAQAQLLFCISIDWNCTGQETGTV